MLKFRLLIVVLFCVIACNQNLFAQMHPEFVKHLGISRPTYSLFVKGNPAKVKSETERLGGKYKFHIGDISSINIPSKNYEEFIKGDWFESAQLSYYLGRTLDDQSNINNNVNAVHNGTTPLPQKYDGTGVIVGVMDYLLDFNHHDFKLPNGHSRIKYYWNQHDTSGSVHPAPYGYGRDYDSAAINAHQIIYYPDSAYSYGHGTLTTGIAVGNSQQYSNYRGVATNADIIFVGIDMQSVTGNSFEACVADAANYIFTKAAALGKPCVINASIGTYGGSHDGTDLATQAIENLLTAQSGRAFVCAAGNGGGRYMHLGYTIPTNDSAYTYFGTFSVGTQKVMYFELFSDYADWNNAQFAIGTDYTSPYYHLSKSKWLNVLTDYQMSSQTTLTRYDTVRNMAGQRLGVLESYCEKQNGHYFMYFGVYVDSVTNYAWRFITKGTGKFDVWSHPKYTYTSAMQYASLPNTAQLPDISKYILPDTEKTIVGDFNCSPKVISVANYLNRNNYVTWQGTTFNCDAHTVGKIYPSSSKGPTRTGMQKPDIAASGEWTMAANDLFWLNWAKTGNPNSLLSDTMHGPHKGTSAASPVVSGIVALYLQKYPTANWADVKSSITTCVKTDNYTGTSLPNYIYGYGKVDAFKALNCKGCTNPISVNYNSYSQIDDGSCIISIPTAFFKIPTSHICTGDTLNFIDSSTNHPTQWIWSFGGGAQPAISAQQNQQVIFNSPGKHIIHLTVSNNFGNSTYADSLIVFNKPTADFSFIDSICVGYKNIITYTGSATSAANFNWTLGGGIASAPFSDTLLFVKWNSNGTKTIALQVNENGCYSSSVSHQLKVISNPSVSFSYHINAATVTFFNQTSNATNYNWSFGDAGFSNQQNPTHNYSVSGTYVVVLTAQNATCTSSSSDTLSVIAAGVDKSAELNSIAEMNVTGVDLQTTLLVVWKNAPEPRKLQVFNIAGQLMYTIENVKEQFCKINVMAWANAMYLIKSTDTKGNVLTSKWIKNAE